jgi:hypothetical protein
VAGGSVLTVSSVIGAFRVTQVIVEQVFVEQVFGTAVITLWPGSDNPVGRLLRLMSWTG